MIFKIRYIGIQTERRYNQSRDNGDVDGHMRIRRNNKDGVCQCDVALGNILRCFHLYGSHIRINTPGCGGYGNKRKRHSVRHS